MRFGPLRLPLRVPCPWVALILPFAMAAFPSAPCAEGPPAGGHHLGALTLSESGSLRPGQEIAVTWERLPPDTEEFELLLRIEAPATFTLRLTECEDPNLDRICWRVPAVPCERAILLLRHGSKGREELWGESLPFGILRPPGSPLQRVSLRSGELWVTREEAPGEVRPGARQLAGAPGRGGEPGAIPTDLSAGLGAGLRARLAVALFPRRGPGPSAAPRALPPSFLLPLRM